jgi:protocatechuate 3,4-dioxygenase beta subunit
MSCSSLPTPPNRLVTRRAVMRTLGLLGAAPLFGLGLPSTPTRAASALSCTLAPAMTEGPFFVDEKLNRADLTSNTSDAGTLNGLPLYLNINAVSTTSATCAPIAGVQIDVWHCNAYGLYSDISTARGQSTDTTGQTFLRGYQVTDANGGTAFKTIYPGWYSGRTVHIHVKARYYDAAGNKTYEFNTQLFFDDALTDVVFASAPYNSRGARNVRNAADSIYGNNTSVLLSLQPLSGGASGYVANITLGLALDATTAASTVDLDQHGLTGTWYEPATSGQGFVLELFPDLIGTGIGLVQGGWFTFDSGSAGGAEKERWYTISGQAVAGQSSANLAIYQNVGGNFAATPITSATVVGTANLSFSSCDQGQLTYAFSDGTGRTGTIPLTRIMPNVTCSTTSARPTNADFALSGNYYDPATSGQGFIVEANPLAPVLFFAWYTYSPSGSAIGGGASQRWYTGQSASYVPGARSFTVTLYETTGGIFDTAKPAAQTSAVVGNATIQFASCSAATLSYTFTGGTNAGRAGTLALSRVGPIPAGCAV